MFKITRAHVIFSENPDADRAFLRDVLGLAHVDVGGGWLIFAPPPAEMAVHPADTNGAHEVYLMVDDVAEFVSSMTARGLVCSSPRDLRWGVLTQLSLPDGGKLGIYESRHAAHMGETPQQGSAADFTEDEAGQDSAPSNDEARRSTQTAGRGAATCLPFRGGPHRFAGHSPC